MLQFLINLFINSKAMKVSGGIVGGSGAFALILGIIDHKDKSIREYVNFKNKAVMAEVIHIKDGQTEIKDILIKIDNRLYELNKRGNHGK